MKRIWFLLVFCCFLSTSIIIGQAIVNKSGNDVDEINLSGDLRPDDIKSLKKPIQVFITDFDLEINFNNALGVIAISIYDETGSAVYQQSVNAYAGQQIFIDIYSFGEGKYTIEFANSKNEYLLGYFEI